VAHRGVLRAYASGQLPPVHAGQHQVGDQKVYGRRLRRQLRQRVLRGLGPFT
jgi:hypothetical protein